jgi:hypothetical protein
MEADFLTIFSPLAQNHLTEQGIFPAIAHSGEVKKG